MLASTENELVYGKVYRIKQYTITIMARACTLRPCQPVIWPGDEAGGWGLKFLPWLGGGMQLYLL